MLRLDAPELAGLPWEAMYDPSMGRVRVPAASAGPACPVAAVPPPLAVGCPCGSSAWSRPRSGLAPLDTGRERDQLTLALAGLAGQGLAELAWAPTANWGGLHEMLLAGPWHVLHFIGHGDFDPDRDEGVLALTARTGERTWSRRAGSPTCCARPGRCPAWWC